MPMPSVNANSTAQSGSEGGTSTAATGAFIVNGPVGGGSRNDLSTLLLVAAFAAGAFYFWRKTRK